MDTKERLKCVCLEDVYCILLASSVFSIVTGASFTSSPGVVMTYLGDSATFSWRVDDSVDISRSVVEFSYTGIPGSDKRIYFRSPGSDPTWYNGYELRTEVTYNSDNHGLGFTLSHIQTSDTGHNLPYACRVIVFGLPMDDDNADLLIFQTPTVPSITPNPADTVEGSRFTLTCTAATNSVPREDAPAMTYTWTRNGQGIPGGAGASLTFSSVTRADHGQYECEARETESELSNTGSVLLNVQYKPVAPTIQGPPGPPEEGTQLDLTCTVSTDGNPATYTYSWWIDGSLRHTTGSQNSLSINDVTVADHDGVWRCEVDNTIGAVQSGEISVIVHAPAQIHTEPSSLVTRLVNETLSVLCKVEARPAADISWTYVGDVTLPSGVQPQSGQSIENGKYTITSSTLQWRPGSSDAERGNSAGIYTCHGTNGVGDVATSGDVTLTVLYGPLGMTLSDPGPITAVEGDPLTVTCSSECSPSCTYTWTRSDDVTWEHDQPTLSFTSIDRTDHNNYTCHSSNSHGSKKTSLGINVNFASGITDFSTSSDNILHGDVVRLVCTVSSRPESVVTIINQTNILIESSGYRAEFTFSPISILDSGDYRCTAGNGIPPGPEKRTSTIDVPGGFHHCDTNYQRQNRTARVGLNNKVEESICQFANPFYNITRNNWTFEADNDTVTNRSLPEDVMIDLQATEHVYKKLIIFTIPAVSPSHYGTYTMTSGNQHGTSLIFTLTVTPEGGSSQVAIIVGAVVAVVVAAALVILLVMLWRKGILAKKHTSKKEDVVHYENSAADIAEEDKKTRKPAEVQYEDVGNLISSPESTDIKVYEELIADEINEKPIVYEPYIGEKAEVVQYSASDIRPGDVISRGAVFCVQTAVILREKHNQKARNIVMKQTVANDAEVYKRYLLEAAQVVSRLAECPHVVHCAGTAAGSVLLENVPLGNLRQYLRGVADHAYANTSASLESECTGYIEQILHGLDVIFSLKNPALFYCLSTDHVLLGQGQICKLTGFNTADSVRQREQWEQEQGIDRPIYWLAPETIDLQHVQKSDIWGLGVLLWEIVELGRIPYESMDERHIIEYINQGDRLKISPTCSPDIQDVISSCWMNKPDSRRSIGEIKLMLGMSSS